MTLICLSKQGFWYLILNYGEENTLGVNSACSHLFLLTPSEKHYSQLYNCKIGVRDVCNDYIEKFHIEI